MLLLLVASTSTAPTSSLIFPRPSAVARSKAAGKSDEITTLPNLMAKPCWKQFSGYLSTNTSRDTQLFYWYHEAVSEPATKPLILWLNGGPGCSSLGGMFTELGPLVVGMDGNVSFNPYSFNKVANVLFLEQPAGVGFSYPNLPANDSTTAEETYRALRNFFDLHPELRGRPFYVMGESYVSILQDPNPRPLLQPYDERVFESLF